MICGARAFDLRASSPATVSARFSLPRRSYRDFQFVDNSLLLSKKANEHSPIWETPFATRSRDKAPASTPQQIRPVAGLMDPAAHSQI